MLHHLGVFLILVLYAVLSYFVFSTAPTSTEIISPWIMPALQAITVPVVYWCLKVYMGAWRSLSHNSLVANMFEHTVIPMAAFTLGHIVGLPLVDQQLGQLVVGANQVVVGLLIVGLCDPYQVQRKLICASYLSSVDGCSEQDKYFRYLISTRNPPRERLDLLPTDLTILAAILFGLLYGFIRN